MAYSEFPFPIVWTPVPSDLANSQHKIRILVLEFSSKWGKNSNVYIGTIGTLKLISSIRNEKYDSQLITQGCTQKLIGITNVFEKKYVFYSM